MPVSLSKKLAIARRRQQIAELYLKGLAQTAIAEQLAVEQSTVCRDLKAIHKAWRDSAVRDFDMAREEELQKLELIEREAWAAWERSQKPSQEARSKDGDMSKAAKRMKSQHGDARCLDLVLKCVTNRRALLGLDLAQPVVEVHNHAHLHGADSLDGQRQRILEMVAQLRRQAGGLEIEAEFHQPDDRGQDRPPSDDH